MANTEITETLLEKTKEELLQMIAGVTRYSYNELSKLDGYLDGAEIQGECDLYCVEVESIRGAEGDGAEMFLTIKITDKETREEYFVEFFGRYSSWDSSRWYYRSYVVEPYQELVTFYRPIPEVK